MPRPGQPACKRLSRDARPDETKLAHALKMKRKRAAYHANCDTAWYARQTLKGKHAAANLSTNHPDRGCTPAQHAARKAKRLAAALKPLRRFA